MKGGWLALVKHVSLQRLQRLQRGDHSGWSLGQRGSAVAVSGDRFRKAANRLQLAI